MDSTPSPIRTLSLTFDLPIYPRQIPQWRGAFIEMAGLGSTLFHNHNGGEGYHYRYPLIQYRVYRGKASILAINEGVQAVQQALSENTWELNWQGLRQNLNIEDMRLDEHALRMTSRPKHYNLYKWLALNQDNYQRWQKCKNLIERIQLLEEVLVGHILSFCTAMSFQLPERLEVNLQNMQLLEKVRCHEVEVLAFNVSYSANINLPRGIGLGKSVSHGFGWQVAKRMHPNPPRVSQAPMDREITSSPH